MLGKREQERGQRLSIVRGCGRNGEGGNVESDRSRRLIVFFVWACNRGGGNTKFLCSTQIYTVEASFCVYLKKGFKAMYSWIALNQRQSTIDKDTFCVSLSALSSNYMHGLTCRNWSSAFHNLLQWEPLYGRSSGNRDSGLNVTLWYCCRRNTLQKYTIDARCSSKISILFLFKRTVIVFTVNDLTS